MKRAQLTAIRRGSKVRAVYDLAHLAWRARAISDFYYGKRSPSDPTAIWTIDGTEYPSDDLDAVRSAVLSALARAGIADVSPGGSWCGYRSLRVSFADGSRLIERFDGTRVVVERSNVRMAA
jgi:hypothetical protein